MKAKPAKIIEASPPQNAVQLDATAAGILRTLLAERDAMDAKVTYFLNQCAAAHGLSFNDYNLHLPTMTFVRK
jgi:hypothetical protein